MQIKPMKIAMGALAALFLPAVMPAAAGFKSAESMVRNVYAHYGSGASGLSKGLPRDSETAANFFDSTLRNAWATPRREPYDFLVQGSSWKLGAVAIAILRRQFDKTYATVAFDNQG